MNEKPFAPGESRNTILGALSQEEAARLGPHLRPLRFGMGEELAQPGQAATQTYFVEAGVLSSIIASSQNVSVEVALCGREGAWDAQLCLNGLPRIDRTVVQATGWGWALPAPVLQQEFARGGTVQERLLLHLDFLYTQSSLTGLCNRLHTTEERLARWLLMMRSMTQSDEFEMPLEFLAAMLGSRLSGVTIVMGVLQRAGLIAVDGQRIALLNPSALERTACECYATLQQRLQRCTQAQSTSENGVQE